MRDHQNLCQYKQWKLKYEIKSFSSLMHSINYNEHAQRNPKYIMPDSWMPCLRFHDFSISKYITKHIKIYKKILDLKMYEPIYRIAIYKWYHMVELLVDLL